ncbi:hypothetical protein ACEN9Z_16325, partial [Stenotrophomonas geniculata]
MHLVIDHAGQQPAPGRVHHLLAVARRQPTPTAALGDFTVPSANTPGRDYRRPPVGGGPLVDYAGSNLG